MKHLISFILLLAIILLVPTSVRAQEKIKNFNTEITAHQNGEMTITETIEYDFGSDNRHGIYRFIPTYTSVGNLYRVSDIKFTEVLRDNKKEPHENSYGADEVETKIGDADRTIFGVHTYKIVYSVKNGIGSNYEDHDEIYWNITGNKWDIPIEKVTATITTDFNAVPTKTICFTGIAGSKDSNCSSSIKQNLSETITTKLLEENEGLTVVTAFPVNTFPKSQLVENPPLLGKDGKVILGIYGLVWIILNIIVTPFLIRWYLKNKNKTRLGKPAVNFDIPKLDHKVVTPLEAGIIDNTKLEQNDVMATIFDLAIRKYIKIEQIEGKKKLGIFGGKDDYKIVKLKNFDNQLNVVEVTLLDKLLGGGNEKKLSEVKTFYTTFQSLETKSFQILLDRKLYTKNPKSQKSLLIVFGIIGLVTLNIIFGAVLIFLSQKLNGRTEKGDLLDNQIDGLKIFLKNMKRHYNFQVKNAITVEKYIPYAMALGHIDEFMDQLKDIAPDYNPSWYSGNSNFYAARYAFASSMQSNFTTSAPSSSSGFSGGGSSGGGGGGGGGGSW